MRDTRVTLRAHDDGSRPPLWKVMLGGVAVLGAVTWFTVAFPHLAPKTYGAIFR